MINLTSLTDTELLADCTAHPCYWDSSPSAQRMTELMTRLETRMEEVAQLTAEPFCQACGRGGDET